MPYKDQQSDVCRRRKVEAQQRYRDRNRDKINAVSRKRKEEKKKFLIEYKGGKCVGCGTTHNLQFDHIDRTTKELRSISGCLNLRLETLIKEADKCQLLCRDCHIIKSRTHYDHEELLKGYNLGSIEHFEDRIVITYELHKLSHHCSIQ